MAESLPFVVECALILFFSLFIFFLSSPAAVSYATLLRSYRGARLQFPHSCKWGCGDDSVALRDVNSVYLYK